MSEVVSINEERPLAFSPRPPHIANQLGYSLESKKRIVRLAERGPRGFDHATGKQAEQEEYLRKGLRKLVFVFAIAVAVMGLIPTAENTASADEIISCYRGENTGCLVCLVRTDTGKIKVVVYQCP